MKTKFKQLLIASAVLAVLVILPTAVKADPITFTVDDTHTVAQGSSVTFFGTISNGGPPTTFMNGVTFTFASGVPGSITINDAAFFANVPASMGAGTTTGLVALFDVVVSSLVPPGLYTGTVSLLGGDTASSDDVLGTQDFSITVLPGGQDPIPEPATMLLLGTGLAGLAAARRKRRQARTP